jgi:hypothetical protein
MAKLTYSEQLKHPNWQRRRLERLNAVNFMCESCEETQKTLHVHHHRYVKGRMAWEYDDDELSVLCEDCHAQEHDVRARFDAILSRLDIADIMIMTGYAEGLGLRYSWGKSTELIRIDSGEFAVGLGDALGVSFHEMLDLIENGEAVAGNVLWQLVMDSKNKVAK